ncbi:MAG: 3-deoxy-D-manno-octulosonic acid transferase, partial [Halocynthiibacter sp.]
MLLRVYLILSILIGPLWRFAILRRVKRGKEDPKRVQEKFGTATLARPEGPLIWFHALSVGESLALLTLFETLAEQEPEAHFLLTTTTRSSVEALEKITLPPRVMHQYLPADTRRATQKFLAYWRPDKVVFSEFDLWPRMLFEVKKREIPAILMNVRLGAARAKKRKKIQSLMVFCFSVFDKILAQDAVSVPHIMEFDVPREKLSVVGSIKGSRAPLPDQAADRENIEKMVGDRPRWFSAASHPDEDPMLIAAHAEILKSDPRMLLIMAPRYMDRLYGLLQAVEDHGLIMARRSLGEDITPETQIYLADSFGEMGLWYRLSPVSALGHSMVEG